MPFVMKILEWAQRRAERLPRPLGKPIEMALFFSYCVTVSISKEVARRRSLLEDWLYGTKKQRAIGKSLKPVNLRTQRALSVVSSDDGPGSAGILDQQRSPLFKLPAEIRSMIWQSVYSGESVEVRGPSDAANKALGEVMRQPMALSRTCRRIYTETIDLLYSTVTFTFTSNNIYHTLIPAFQKSILPRRWNLIHLVEVTWCVFFWHDVEHDKVDACQVTAFWDMIRLMASLPKLEFLKLNCAQDGPDRLFWSSVEYMQPTPLRFPGTVLELNTNWSDLQIDSFMMFPDMYRQALGYEKNDDRLRFRALSDVFGQDYYFELRELMQVDKYQRSRR